MYACGRERTKHKRSPDMFFFSYPNAPNHPTTQPSTTAPINQSCTKNARRPKMPILLLVSQLLLVFCGASFVSPSPFHPLPHTHTHTLTHKYTHAHSFSKLGVCPHCIPVGESSSHKTVVRESSMQPRQVMPKCPPYPHMTTHKNNKTKNIYNVCLSGPRRSIVRPLVSHKQSSWLVQATVCCVSSWSTGRSVFLSVCRPGGSRLPDAVMALSCESMDICVATMDRSRMSVLSDTCRVPAPGENRADDAALT